MYEIWNLCNFAQVSYFVNFTLAQVSHLVHFTWLQQQNRVSHAFKHFFMFWNWYQLILKNICKVFPLRSLMEGQIHPYNRYDVWKKFEHCINIFQNSINNPVWWENISNRLKHSCFSLPFLLWAYVLGDLKNLHQNNKLKKEMLYC